MKLDWCVIFLGKQSYRGILDVSVLAQLHLVKDFRNRLDTHTFRNSSGLNARTDKPSHRFFVKAVHTNFGIDFLFPFPLAYVSLQKKFLIHRLRHQ